MGTSTESSTSMNETTSTINTEEVTKCLNCTTITTEASTFHPNLTVVPSPVIEDNNSTGVTIGVIMAVLAFIGCIIFVALSGAEDLAVLTKAARMIWSD